MNGHFSGGIPSSEACATLEEPLSQLQVSAAASAVDWLSPKIGAVVRRYSLGDAPLHDLQLTLEGGAVNGLEETGIVGVQ